MNSIPTLHTNDRLCRGSFAFEHRGVDFELEFAPRYVALFDAMVAAWYQDAHVHPSLRGYRSCEELRQALGASTLPEEVRGKVYGVRRKLKLAILAAGLPAPGRHEFIETLPKSGYRIGTRGVVVDGSPSGGAVPPAADRVDTRPSAAARARSSDTAVALPA